MLAEVTISAKRFRVPRVELQPTPRHLDHVMGFELPGEPAPTTTEAVTVEDSSTEARIPAAASAVEPFQPAEPTNSKTISRGLERGPR